MIRLLGTSVNMSVLYILLQTSSSREEGGGDLAMGVRQCNATSFFYKILPKSSLGRTTETYWGHFLNSIMFYFVHFVTENFTN